MPDAAAPGPLAPFRVLDLTGEIGQLAGRMLGDLGADVIKVEPPAGDPARGNPPFHRDLPDRERSLFWWVFNHDKRGVTLDIETERGRDLLLRLIAEADFLLETHAPGALDRLGLSRHAVAAANPRIVHATITPFGSDGPCAQWKATDLIAVAMGGLATLCGELGRNPIRPSAPQAFVQASAQAVVGALIAHYHRTKTGRGQHVDQSMQEAIIVTQDHATATWDIRGVNNWRPGNGRVIGGYPAGPYVYESADGYVAAMSFGGLFGLTARQTIDWLDHHGAADDLASEEWLAKLDATQGVLLPPGGEDAEHLRGVLARFCKRFPSEQLVREAQQIRNGWAVTSTPGDLLANEHLQARDYWAELEHEDLGETFRYPGPWAKLSKTPIAMRRRAPHLGEHNEEVYGGLLGLTTGEIAGLRRAAII